MQSARSPRPPSPVNRLFPVVKAQVFVGERGGVSYLNAHGRRTYLSRSQKERLLQGEPIIGMPPALQAQVRKALLASFG